MKINNILNGNSTALGLGLTLAAQVASSVITVINNKKHRDEHIKLRKQIKSIKEKGKKRDKQLKKIKMEQRNTKYQILSVVDYLK